MQPARIEHLELRGSDIAVRLWDNPDATWQAVLVHGYGEHAGRYDHVADRLRQAGATVVAMDHVGHGRSGGDRVLIEDFEPVVGDVVDVIRSHRADDLPLAVIGHSMGGMIAARLAQRGDLSDDLAALVLSAPVLGNWSAATGLLELDEIPDVALDPSTLSRDPAVGEDYAEDELVWHGPFKRPTLQGLADEVTTINEGARLAVPTLWIHGEDDQLVPIEATRAGIERIRPDADFHQRTWPQARHEVFNEVNKDDVLDVVVAFLTEALDG